MNELLIGTRGWNESEWADDYYPDDMPEDWRFCFYSNNFRAVLIPETILGVILEGLGAKDVGDWAEDSDQDFKFILELPGNLLSAPDSAPIQEALSKLEECIAAIKPRVAGLLWKPEPSGFGDASEFKIVLDILMQKFRICLDLEDQEMRNLAVEQGAGICWHVNKEPEPVPGGQLLVSFSDEADNKNQRAIVEKAAAWLTNDNVAGIFFTGERAAKNAEDTRVIAELLNV